MDNSKMTAGRYERWAKSRKIVRDIKQHLASGGLVVISTYTKVWRYDVRHVDWFEARRSGAYVRQGKSFVYFEGCRIAFWSQQKAS